MENFRHFHVDKDNIHDSSFVPVLRILGSDSRSVLHSLLLLDSVRLLWISSMEWVQHAGLVSPNAQSVHHFQRHVKK